MHTGKIGRDLTTEDGYKLARLVAVNLIATIKGTSSGAAAAVICTYTAPCR